MITVHNKVRRPLYPQAVRLWYATRLAIGRCHHQPNYDSTDVMHNIRSNRTLNSDTPRRVSVTSSKLCVRRDCELQQLLRKTILSANEPMAEILQIQSGNNWKLTTDCGSRCSIPGTARTPGRNWISSQCMYRVRPLADSDDKSLANGIARH